MPDVDSGWSAQSTYDIYAAAYDDFNHAYMNERWTGRLLATAERAGLEGNRLLDVGCGTGLSFLPMLARGWTVTGCDISTAMLDLARAKLDGRPVKLIAADMRALPEVGEFDLCWAVNDALNYLLNPAELQSALEGMRRNLAPTGLIVFDVNTVAAYRRFFSSETIVEINGRRFVWKGLMSGRVVTPGGFNEAEFHSDEEVDLAHKHRQRHFAEDEVLAAIESASLECVGVYGESNGNLVLGLDEEDHTKAVYIARLGL